ncbi:AMP phosphorylase [Candidatus Woesearchaeota archaeon]|nr:AMP phosphorylase [Candidatus Woesearchaeota archaeon]
MKLKVKDMNIRTGGVLVGLMTRKDAQHYDLHPSDRIKITKGRKTETVMLDIWDNEEKIPVGVIGLFEEVLSSLDAKGGDEITIAPANKPLSVEIIKKKLDGKKLTKQEINQIVWDIVHDKLTDIELTYFVAACYAHALDMDETTYLTLAMKNEGDQLKLKHYPVMDKHCVGGVAGNRTTMIVVPLLAAAGLCIPKTSSRSITSPAGTADTMEVLADVTLTMPQLKHVINKTGACMVWGGALNLAPADDKIIRVERPLMIDAKSQLLASVMAKKASVSATHVLVDIPYGEGSKIPTVAKANELKRDFELIAKHLDLKVKVLLTDGRQPIGNGIGPVLEARDVLWVLLNDAKAPQDLRAKAIMLAATMLEMAGKAKQGKGKKIAEDLLNTGSAYRKLVDIIQAQGAKAWRPEQLKLGKELASVTAQKTGSIIAISSEAISKIARIAGAPADPQAGIFLHHHVSDKVKKGDALYTIYADNRYKLENAAALAKESSGVQIRAK